MRYHAPLGLFYFVLFRSMLFYCILFSSLVFCVNTLLSYSVLVLCISTVHTMISYIILMSGSSGVDDFLATVAYRAVIVV